MSRLTEPVEYADSVTALTGEKLRAMGVTALLIDLDNTLVYWRTDEFVPGAEKWLEDCVREGFECCLFSNRKQEGCRRLAEKKGVAYVSRAAKPLPFSYRRAAGVIRAPQTQWLAVGDQIFTDVLGANLAGVRAVYVSPASQREWAWTQTVRKLERFVLRKRGIRP